MTESALGSAPVIKVTGLAHVSFQVPDLELARSFLLDFGLRQVAGNGGALYMTGGDAPFLYKAELGAPKFIGLGLAASSEEDLAGLAAATDSEVVAIGDPGGGKRVRLTDPDGFVVDVVAGQRHDPGADGGRDEAWNTALRRERVGTTKRLAAAPSYVVRPGHCVLGVSDFSRSEAWYKARFGFLTSDAIEREGGKQMGAFLRCDRAGEASDHHTLFLAETGEPPKLRHIAFEVRDLDSLMVGHEFLKSRGHASFWGIGRHMLGSQIFDYWRDPWGNLFEHMTDGDLFTSSDAPNVATQKELAMVQWGPATPNPEDHTTRKPK